MLVDPHLGVNANIVRAGLQITICKDRVIANNLFKEGKIANTS